jgi:hypothetical protein
MSALPADEDLVPPQQANGQPPLFHFFGLGQPGPAPFNPQNQHAHNVLPAALVIDELNED